jgi:hypothetical protein
LDRARFGMTARQSRNLRKVHSPPKPTSIVIKTNDAARSTSPPLAMKHPRIAAQVQ